MSGICTGSSVVGMAFDGGVIIAADTLVSYGSMARFRNCERIKVVNNHTVVAASGDYADYQFLTDIIEQKQIDEEQWNDGIQLQPLALHSWITRVVYNRRSNFEPLFCSWVVGGVQPNEKTGALEPFLGFVDHIGTAYKSNIVCSGFGQLFAVPMIREIVEKVEKKLPSEQEARSMIAKCLEVLYLRDARSFPRFKQVIVKTDGVTHEGPLELTGNWETAHYQRC